MDSGTLRFSPEFLERYDELELISTTRMSSVYRARQRSLGRPVAVKFLSQEPVADELPLRRFLAEGKVHGRIEHPNVLRVIETGTMGRIPYLVLEWAGGGSLRDRLVEGGRLDEGSCLELVEALAEGLAAIHAQGAVHRDVKPGNVLFDETGHPRLTDFGIVRFEGSSQILTRTGVVLGTPYYVAPELLLGERADARADLYSLGVMLFEMSTGKVPFDESDIATLARAHLDRDPPFPPDMPRSCRELVSRLMAKDPRKRLPSARAVSEWVRRRRSGRDGASRERRRRPVAPSRPAPSPGFARRRWALVLVLGMVGLALLGGLVLALRRGGSATDWSSPFLDLRCEQVLDHLLLTWRSPFPDRADVVLRRRGSPWSQRRAESELGKRHRLLVELRGAGEHLLRVRSSTGATVERPVGVRDWEQGFDLRFLRADRLALRFESPVALTARLLWAQRGEEERGEPGEGTTLSLEGRFASDVPLERLAVEWRPVGDDGPLRSTPVPLPARPVETARALVTQFRLAPLEDRLDAFMARALVERGEGLAEAHRRFREEIRHLALWPLWAEARPWLGSFLADAKQDAFLRRALLEQLGRWDALEALSLCRELETLGPVVKVDEVLEPALLRFATEPPEAEDAFAEIVRRIGEGRGRWLRPPEDGLVLLRGRPSRDRGRDQADVGLEAGYLLGFEMGFPALNRLVPSTEEIALPSLPVPEGGGTGRIRLGAELLAPAPYNRLVLSWPGLRASNLSCSLRNRRRPSKGFLEMAEVKDLDEIRAAFARTRSLAESSMPLNLVPDRLGPGTARLRLAWYGRQPVIALRAIWLMWER